MVKFQQIRAYIERIAAEFKPERILLFGSYANGAPTEDSDVDLLVVMRHEGRSVDQAIKIRQKIDAPFPLDLMVRTPEKIKERLAAQDCFMKEIMDEGSVLYEAGNRRMDPKSRGRF